MAEEQHLIFDEEQPERYVYDMDEEKHEVALSTKDLQVFTVISWPCKTLI